MFQLLNRITWVLSISIGLIIIAIDTEFIIFGFIAPLLIKYFFFSPTYIKSRLAFFQKKLGETSDSHESYIVSQEKTEVQETQDYSFSDDTSLQKDTENLQKEVSYYEYEEKQNKTDHAYSVALGENENTSQNELFAAYNPSRVISQFFSENIIAKVGGIIVFIGVFFFLTVIYTLLGPVTKMILGFAIGFSCFGAGVFLDKRGYPNEARIVMGMSLLINYLVILGGRYLLTGDTETGNFLPIGVMFVFLILNTLFGVTTSLVYKSHTLLIFSFVFAYINPLLLGSPSDEPYTLLGYTMIVTLGALFMSYTRKDIILFTLSFIAAAFFFLVAPDSDGTGWIVKLLCINTLGALGLFVSSAFEKKYQYLSEILVGGSFFLIGLMGLLTLQDISITEFALLGVSSLALMVFCYVSMHRGAYLYSIGTLGTIVTLSPALALFGIQDGYLGIATCIIAVFGLLNIGVLLQKNKNLISENIGNILSGLISGALFLTFMIYLYGNEYFPGVLQGFAFFALATVYIGVAFVLVQSIGVEKMKSEEKYKNIFYALASLGLSLFSLAIAFVFSQHPEVISIIWLLEANILFFFAKKLSSSKIFFGALVLLIIGVLRIIPFLDMSVSRDYGVFIAFGLIALSLLGNVFLLCPKNDVKKTSFPLEFYFIHHFFHIGGIIVASVLIYGVFPNMDDWMTLVYFSLVLSILGYIYNTLTSSAGLQKMYMLGYILALCTHIFFFADNLGQDSMNLSLSTLIVGLYTLPFIAEYLEKKQVQHLGLLSLFFGYLFILSTLYVQHIFAVTFAITFYWGILSFVLLSYGISANIISLRTLGLYLLTLTVGKIFLYDIWDSSVADGVGFLVFIATGVLMIVLSTMYTKKFGNTLNSEFNLSNLLPKKKDTAPNKTSPSQKKSSNPITHDIQKDIEAIKIPGIIGVRMHINTVEKPIQIRATNLIKIAKLIENSTGKTSFQAGELSGIYELISKNYQSSLTADQYKKIQDIVQQFVEKGGSMEFVTE